MAGAETDEFSVLVICRSITTHRSITTCYICHLLLLSTDIVHNNHSTNIKLGNLDEGQNLSRDERCDMNTMKVASDLMFLSLIFTLKAQKLRTAKLEPISFFSR